MTVTRTPVPYRIILPLAVIYFIDAFCFTSLFSYVGFMVWDFHLTEDEDEVGFYAGYIGSCFSFAQFLSSFWWGRLSDRYGRKPILLIGSFGSLLSTCFFGFSTNLWMAIITRSASGILNGNVGVVKSYAADVCDKTNQVKSFSIMQLFWGMGNILGPLVGGLASRPCTTYNICSETSLFGRYPYLLPNMVPAVISAIGIVLLWYGLPNVEARKPKYVELKEANSSPDFSISEESETAPLEGEANQSTSSSGDSDSTDGADGADDVSGDLVQSKPKQSFVSKLLSPFKKSPKEYRKLDKDTKSGIHNSVFKNRLAIACCVLYSILGAAYTMYDEAFPLWAMASVEKGGIAATTKTIGLIGTINGVSAVLLQLTVFAPLAQKLGFVNLLRVGTVVGALLMANFPILNIFYDKPVEMWAIMVVFVFLKVSAGQFAFTAVSCIISNSTPLSQVGSANGFGQSLVALTRAISPAVAGTLLSWGFASSRGFPLNQYGVFLVMSFLMATIAVGSFFLPRSLDHPFEDKTAPKTGDEESAELTRELEMAME